MLVDLQIWRNIFRVECWIPLSWIMNWRLQRPGSNWLVLSSKKYQDRWWSSWELIKSLLVWLTFPIIKCKILLENILFFTSPLSYIPSPFQTKRHIYNIYIWLFIVIVHLLNIPYVYMFNTHLKLNMEWAMILKDMNNVNVMMIESSVRDLNQLSLAGIRQYSSDPHHQPLSISCLMTLQELSETTKW